MQDNPIDSVKDGIDIVIHVGPLVDTYMIAEKIVSSRLIMSVNHDYL